MGLSKPPSNGDTHSEVGSIADAVIRRTEPERIQYFEQEQECDEFETRRAHCKKCNVWVNLGAKQTYAVRPWEQHKLKCGKPPVRLVSSGP